MADEQKQDQDKTDECGTTEYWAKEFAAAKKWFQKYHALARKIEKTFLLEGDNDTEGADTRNVKAKYNLFWANTKTILAAMYGRMPKAEVDRTNMDPNDDGARVACLILERIFNFEFHNIDDSPYYVYQECVQDRMISGMGIAWARYDFQESVKTITPPVLPGQEEAKPIEVPIITDEQAPLDYVNWEDFLYSPCKRWQDRRWTAKRVYMDKAEATKRFGGQVAAGMNYDSKSNARSNEDPLKASTESQAEVWEIWNITNRTVYWYSAGAKDLLKTQVDPLGLQGFWPLKRPLFATMLPKKCLPRPDFLYARSQYAELNLIVERCQLLTEALRVVGVYDKNAEALQRLLGQAAENQMIPVDNWAMFADKGGIKGAIDWFPLEMVVNALEKLVLRKAVLVQEVYEILGISDIQRGMAMTKETATTQRLKAQYGSARSEDTRSEIARFITDHTRLRAEIICKQWDPQTILARSQIDKTPDAPYAAQAIQLLKSDPSVVARITITADTIAAPDWDLEKQQRIDFLQAISQFVGMMEPIIKEDPGATPFMVEILKWAATGFKGAKQIEGVFDRALQALTAKAQELESKPKEPSAEEKLKLAQAEKAQAEARYKNLETALASMGFDISQLQSLTIIPPTEPMSSMGSMPSGGVPGGQPPAAGSDRQTPGAPPAHITPRIQRPGVQ